MEALPDVHLGAWAKKRQVAVTPAMRVVTASFARRGAHFELDLWVEGLGVRAVWKSGMNGAREIALPDWLKPVWREKDHALQRVSTLVATADGYEFDFQMLVARDAGVHAVWKLGSFESRL